MFQNKPPKKKPQKSIWHRVFRFSTYFTVIGSVLTILRYQTMRTVTSSHHSTSTPSIDSFTQDLAVSYQMTFSLLLAFSVLSLVIMLISIYMLSRKTPN